MQMILLVGTKLQHIIQQLSLETAQSQGVIGVKIVEARDSLFWFNRPQILLSLIHFILFQNAFELAFFLWILVSNQVQRFVIAITVLRTITCQFSHATTSTAEQLIYKGWALDSGTQTTISFSSCSLRSDLTRVSWGKLGRSSHGWSWGQQFKYCAATAHFPFML